MSNSEKAKTNLTIENRFYILGDFDDRMIEEIIVPLEEYIEKKKNVKNSEVEIHINSRGGYAHIAFHILDLMEKAKNYEITVKTFVIGRAYSAGSLISVAGTPGERYISPNAEQLIHYGEFGGYRYTTPTQGKRGAEHFERHTQKIEKHYKKYCKVPKLSEKIQDDFLFIPPEQCIEWGLSDKYTYLVIKK